MLKIAVLVLLVALSCALKEAPTTLQIGYIKSEECKRKSRKGDKLSMHYTGTIFDAEKKGNRGDKFDSSLDRKDPFDFTLGQGQVIKGWDQGIAISNQGLLDMCIGDKRKLIIPPDMVRQRV